MMSKLIEQIVHLLSDIKEALKENSSCAIKDVPPLPNRRFYNKQDVLDITKMSESTYRRNLKNGLLKPMRLNGTDVYFEEDLLHALEQSRIKGRI